MSLFDQVQSLQREWTDQFVQVDDSIAELKRFAGLTGQVKTVNMSGQALVEFDGSEDIGWYDIHPQFLTVIEVEEEVEVQTEAETETTAAAPAKTAPPAEAADEAPAAEAAPAVDTSKLSPLELARMQDVGGAAAAPAAKKEASEAPAEKAPAKQKPAETLAAPQAADTSSLSPLELARMQDAGGDAPAAAAAPEEAVAEEAPAAEEAEVDQVAEEREAGDDDAVEETAADDSPAATVEIPEGEGPERTSAVLAACRAQDGG